MWNMTTSRGRWATRIAVVATLSTVAAAAMRRARASQASKTANEARRGQPVQPTKTDPPATTTYPGAKMTGPGTAPLQDPKISSAGQHAKPTPPPP